MKVEQILYANGKYNKKPELNGKCNWVLVLGNKYLIKDNNVFNEIREMYPSAYIMGCSTAGEIHDDSITDGELIITAVCFEKSTVSFGSLDIPDNSNHFDIGKNLADQVDKNGLKHLFILADGININGSQFINGLVSVLGTNIPVTGGLAGDDNEFLGTYLIANNYAKSKTIVFAAFYGDIKTGYSANGGWDTFGIERVITKSKGNILYEFDFKPALDLYKLYLGELADKLPNIGYRFPVSVRYPSTENSYVRSLVNIDEETKSIIFGGDVPEGSLCKLMKSNVYNLIDAAKEATDNSMKILSAEKADLAIVISCCGRRAVLKNRTEEEVSIIHSALNKKTIITGFYSYGEIGHLNGTSECQMHNQTMTITLFSE